MLFGNRIIPTSLSTLHCAQDEATLKKYFEKMPDVGKKFENLLNTGNLVSKSGLDLSQSTGFTVVAEKLNFFRSGLVRRGRGEECMDQSRHATTALQRFLKQWIS